MLHILTVAILLITPFVIIAYAHAHACKVWAAPVVTGVSVAPATNHIGNMARAIIALDNHPTVTWWQVANTPEGVFITLVHRDGLVEVFEV